MGTRTEYCTATITVLLDADEQTCRTLTCSSEVGHHRLTKHKARGANVLWEDGDPGATPHAGYRVRRHGRHFQVVPTAGASEYPAVATFYSGHQGHPDPEAAAEAEAARLNDLTCT